MDDENSFYAQVENLADCALQNNCAAIGSILYALCDAIANGVESINDLNHVIHTGYLVPRVYN